MTVHNESVLLAGNEFEFGRSRPAKGARTSQQIATQSLCKRVGGVKLFQFEFMNVRNESVLLAKNDFKSSGLDCVLNTFPDTLSSLINISWWIKPCYRIAWSHFQK